MSLSDIVSKFFKFSASVSAAALIYLSGCRASYDSVPERPVRTQVQTERMFDDFSVEPSQTNSPDVIQSPIVTPTEKTASAVVTVTYSFKDFDNKLSSDWYVSAWSRVDRVYDLQDDNYTSALKWDTEDGVIDDVISGRVSNPKGFDTEKDVIFDFTRVKSMVDSELMYSGAEFTRSQTLHFPDSKVRDEFVSGISKRSVAFGYVMWLVHKVVGSDEVFDRADLRSFFEQLDSTINEGKMAAGRGSVVPKGKEDEDAGKWRHWNAYVSPIYEFKGSPEELERARELFIEAGLFFSDTYERRGFESNRDTGIRYGVVQKDRYDSLIEFANACDAHDGKSDGVILFESVRDLHGRETVLEGSMSQLTDGDRFNNWPRYTPVIKFSFTSSESRDDFVRHFSGLPVLRALVAEFAFDYVGLDGVFQHEEVKNAIDGSKSVFETQSVEDLGGEIYPKLGE